MNAPLYTRDILRLAATIPSLARFEDLDEGSELRSPTCGSRIRTAVKLDDEGQVQSIRQAVEACAFGQAAASLVGAHAVGRNADEARAAVAGVEQWLGGDDAGADAWPDLIMLAPARSRRGRHGAILLPFRALLAAIEGGK